MVRVRLVPLPAKKISLLRARLVFEEAAARVSESAAVSASPMTKPIGGVEISSSVTWSAMGDIVGKELTKTAVAALLLVVTNSVVAVATDALFVTLPASKADAIRLMTAVAPLVRVPSEQVTTPLL